ncbi:MAG: hypothetical protein HZC36_10790 [Armatimonadetes bacterium]|nr:hypothetical protein [Armatimonadota bacterium]
MFLSAVLAVATASSLAPSPDSLRSSAPPAGGEAVPFALSLGTPRTIQGPHVMAVTGASTGSRIAATFENSEVRIMDAKTGMTLRKFSTPQPAYGIAFNAKGSQVATGDESGRIIIWNAANGQKVKEIRPHTKGVQFVCFNKDGSRVMSTGKDDVMKLINIGNGKVEKTVLGKGQNLYSATFVPGGFVVGTLGFCPQVRKGPAVYKLQGHSDKSSFDVDFNAKTNRVLSAGRDGKAMLFSIIGAKLQTFSGHEDWVVHARLSPNGRYAATSSIDRTVRVFNCATGACDATIKDQSPVAAPICFTGDGKYLVTANGNDQIQIWPLNPAQK